MNLARVLKFNPYHGPDGRFASGPGGAKHGANHPAAASIRLHQIMLGVRMSSLLSGVRISPNQNKPGSNRLLSPFGHLLKQKEDMAASDLNTAGKLPAQSCPRKKYKRLRGL